MKLLKTFNNFLKGKIEKKKLVIQERDELQEQVRKDHAEFILISEKKSTLSRKERDLVKARINAFIALGYINVVEDEEVQ